MVWHWPVGIFFLLLNNSMEYFMFYFRRKQVGVLAAAHWNHTYPKFNTPERKAELAKLAASINKECAVPAAGFNTDGIARHIQDFFNEQRRYKKRKLVCDIPSSQLVYLLI